MARIDRICLMGVVVFVFVSAMMFHLPQASAQMLLTPDGLKLTSAQMDELALYEKNERMQLWGKVFLGGGFLGTIAGIVLIEIDSWGTIGKSGFITGGASVGLMGVGMFLLGFSSPNHPASQILGKNTTVSAVPLQKGRGMALFFNRFF